MLVVYEMLKVFGYLTIRRLLSLHLNIHLQSRAPEGEMPTEGAEIGIKRRRARAKGWQKSRRKKLSLVCNG